MNPKQLGKIDNHKQEPWKAPLPQFIEHLYFERFDRERPEVVRSIEYHAREQARKKAARKEAKRLNKASRGLPSAAGVLTEKPLERGGQCYASGQRPSKTRLRVGLAPPTTDRV